MNFKIPFKHFYSQLTTKSDRHCGLVGIDGSRFSVILEDFTVPFFVLRFLIMGNGSGFEAFLGEVLMVFDLKNNCFTLLFCPHG